MLCVSAGSWVDVLLVMARPPLGVAPAAVAAIAAAAAAAAAAATVRPPPQARRRRRGHVLWPTLALPATLLRGAEAAGARGYAGGLGKRRGPCGSVYRRQHSTNGHGGDGRRGEQGPGAVVGLVLVYIRSRLDGW